MAAASYSALLIVLIIASATGTPALFIVLNSVCLSHAVTVLALNLLLDFSRHCTYRFIMKRRRSTHSHRASFSHLSLSVFLSMRRAADTLPAPSDRQTRSRSHRTRCGLTCRNRASTGDSSNLWQMACRYVWSTWYTRIRVGASARASVLTL